jgi:hypothetical protein
MRYKINVLTLGNQLLNFHVSEYKIKDGLVQFVDEKTGLKKNFPVSACEIEEVKE